MSVSIVIPSFNRWHFLDECLASVAAQTDRDWEAIVVNDGSSEPDTDGIRGKWSDAKFRWIDHETSRGPAAARNTGIRAANHPLIFTLDNDDTLYPQCLERLRPLFGDGQIDCAFPDFEFFGEEERIHRFEDLEIGKLANSQFIPAQVLMRKSLWEKAGGYCEDPALPRGNEDWDFWLGAAAKGFRYQHLHEPLYRYRVHKGGLSKTSLIREDWRSRKFMYRRHQRFIDYYSSRKEFLAPGYWRSAAALCGAGSALISLAIGFRAFTLQPNALLARDLIRRNLVSTLKL
jgi:glycosyltransferase involved in cell wall biosynthesis